MTLSRKDADKIAEALDILRRCIGRNGVYADTSRYRYQCWTRDFALAIQPVLHMVPGGIEAGEWHLLSLERRQRRDGKMPILFLDGLRGHVHFLQTKMWKSVSDRKLSFMLRRYLSGGLGDLTPGTRDSELMYLLVLAEQGTSFSDSESARKALSYIEDNLVDDCGMLRGADWRDTMHLELRDKALLSNNVILYGVLRHAGRDVWATRLRKTILTRWEDGILVDYPGARRFDPLGGALAVMHGVTGPEHADRLVACFRSVDTDRGVTIRCRHNPQSAAEAAVIERTDGVVVWPFVVGFVACALELLGTPTARVMAQEQRTKLFSLDGFREWYDPATGVGYGAKEQLWSAALTLRAAITGPRSEQEAWEKANPPDDGFGLFKKD